MYVRNIQHGELRWIGWQAEASLAKSGPGLVGVTSPEAKHFPLLPVCSSLSVCHLPSTILKTAMSAIRFAIRGATLSRAAFVPMRTQARWSLPQRATFASAAGLNKDDISKRVLNVLKGFERVDATKVCSRAIGRKYCESYVYVLAHTDRCLR
jgi:hypothetical protein